MSYRATLSIILLCTSCVLSKHITVLNNTYKLATLKTFPLKETLELVQLKNDVALFKKNGMVFSIPANGDGTDTPNVSQETIKPENSIYTTNITGSYEVSEYADVARKNKIGQLKVTVNNAKTVTVTVAEVQTNNKTDNIAFIVDRATGKNYGKLYALNLSNVQIHGKAVVAQHIHELGNKVIHAHSDKHKVLIATENDNEFHLVLLQKEVANNGMEPKDLQKIKSQEKVLRMQISTVIKRHLKPIISDNTFLILQKNNVALDKKMNNMKNIISRLNATLISNGKQVLKNLRRRRRDVGEWCVKQDDFDKFADDTIKTIENTFESSESVSKFLSEQNEQYYDDLCR